MFNALIIVWRESLEAMLVIGILLAWIARQPDPAPLRRGLWFGVLAGLGLAVALGFATFAAQSQLEGEALETFQVSMVLFAAALMDDRQAVGRILADFLGYRARPSGTLLIAYAAFWTLALSGLAYLGRAPAAKTR